MRIVVCDDVFDIGKTAAQTLISSASQALGQGRRCSVALSGGSTPKHLFDALTQAAVDPEILQRLRNVDWFFSDERFVAHEDSQSNFKLASDFLFSQIEIDKDAVFAVPTHGLSPDEAASQYEAMVKKNVVLNTNGNPTFDMIFLGMGDDGHTASLFPGTELVDLIIDDSQAARSLVRATFVQTTQSQRITFMPSLINSAKQVVILVSGEQKAKRLQQVLEGPSAQRQFPVQLVSPQNGILTWMVDKASARYLNQG